MEHAHIGVHQLGRRAPTGTPDAGAVPSFLTDVYFTATTGTTHLVNTLGVSATINSLNFTAASASTTIGANDGTTLTIEAGNLGNPGITDLSANAQTVNENLVLASTAGQTWSGTNGSVLTVGGNVNNGGYGLTISGPGATTLSGTVGGAGGLTQAGPGILVLSNTGNSFSGPLRILAGTLQFGATGELGASTTAGTFGSSGITATLEYTGASAGSSGDPFALATSGTGAVQVDTAGTNLTLSGTLSGNGALLKTGAGNLILTASNTYSGLTTLTSGTLQLGDGASNNGYINGNITNNGTLTYADPNGVTVAAAETVAGSIGGSGAVIKTAAGTVILTNTSGYTGGTTVNLGALGVAITTSGTIAPFGSNTVTINSGGEVVLGLQSASDANTHYYANSFVLNGGSLLAFEGIEHVVANLGVGGNGGYLYSAYNGKYLNLDGLVSGTGALTVDSPNTSLGTAAWPSTTPATATMGRLRSMPRAAARAGRRHWGCRMSVAGLCRRAHRCGNQYLPPIRHGHQQQHPRRQQHYRRHHVQHGRPILGALGGSGNTILGENGTTATAVALTVGGDNASTTYSGVISGPGSLTMTGAGTMTLSGNNTFTGGLTLTAGTLYANTSAGALGSGTGTLTLNGGMLDFNNSTGLNFARNTSVGGGTTITSDQSSAGSAGVTYTLGTLNIGATTLNIFGGANVTSGTAGVTFGATTLTGSPTFNVINSAGGGATILTLGALNDGGTYQTITKTGAGTLILSSSATSLAEGTVVNIQGGTLNSNNAYALGTLAQVDVENGAGSVFSVGASQTISALTNSDLRSTDSVLLGSGVTLTVGSTDNQGSAFYGAISGAGALTKAGSGTLTLGGSNTYAGHHDGERWHARVCHRAIALRVHDGQLERDQHHRKERGHAGI